LRLFIAVDLSAYVRTAAGRLVDELRHRAERLSPRARITWVLPERLHLRLLFIGDVDATRTIAIEGALEPPFDLARLDAHLAGTGVFPQSGRPRVIWAGLSAGSDTLATLARLVSARLLSVGVPTDDRPFRPHLTLGRVREAADLRAPRLLSGLDTAELGVVTVTETVLFESQPTKHGHRYFARARTRLRP
jgi:2'-5' RNA ligase